MEKLDRRDWRFVLACLAILIAGAAITSALFRKAFPEAAIEFRVPRNAARALAERFLKERARPTAGTRFAGRFGVDEEPKVYLERELGLDRASRLYGREAKIWRWDMRWFRSAVKEEERVSITPLGNLVSWESVRREDAPGQRLPREKARGLAAAFLSQRGLDPAALTPIESFPTERPKRTDWTFVDERPGFRMKEATVRYRTIVAGGEVVAFEEFVHLPEAWQRDYRTLRSKNEAAGQAATFGLLLTVLAMAGVLLARISRKDVRWGVVGGFGLTGFVLALLSTLNNLPLTFYEYDTASPLSSHLTNHLVLGILGALAAGAGIACVIAAAEPPYRDRFPGQLSLSGIFSLRGLRTKRFFRGVLLGYALVAFFFAYQAVFYVVAARLGAWSPADVPYSDMLSTAFPWATVLLVGFFPAVSEEGISRMFSISFLDGLGAGRFLAVVVPAFIWGFGHAAYPNQPFYIRGVEVGVAGVVIGLVMLRYGVLPLLVWHFTVDALYTALVMLRSHNGYYVVSGAVAAGILLVPLAASILLAWKHGGFAPESGVTNADLGSAPVPVPRAISAEPSAPVRRVSRRALTAAGIAAAVLLAGWLVPVRSPRLGRDEIGRARAESIARAFLRANRVDPARYRSVTYGGTGFGLDADARSEEPVESGRMPGFSEAAARYVVTKGGTAAFEKLASGSLPVNFWVARFLEPGHKEEWKVFVDPRRARVIGYLNPREEAAPGGTPPSEARARERTTGAAAALGYPAADYRVLEVGTRARPKRVDTTVTLESRRADLGDAAPRLTAVFEGSRLSAFYPTVHVPESYLESERRRTALDWLLLGLRVVALGSFLGFAIVLFLRAVRRPDVRWRGLLRPLVPVALLAAAALSNRIPGLLRQYRTEIPLSTFRFSATLSLVILWLLIPCGAAIAYILFSSARPGWRRALRRQGSLGDALIRAAIAAGGLAGISRWSAVAARSVPDLFRPDPSLPGALDLAVPAVVVLSAAALATFGTASVASAAALGSREAFLRRRSTRIALALGALLAFLPASPHSGLELLGEMGGSVVLLGWMAVCAFVLLKDHVAAWVLFGAAAFGGPAAARLLSQPAAPDRFAGIAGFVLLAAVVVALIGTAAREPSLPEAVAAAPPAPPEPELAP
ncbi:MAG: lysostaphin resistance A-like protein [Acidobacteriota bacterium]